MSQSRTPSLKELADAESRSDADCKPLRRIGKVSARPGMVIRNRQVTPCETVRIERVSADKAYAVLGGANKGKGLVLTSGGYLPTGWFEVVYYETSK